MNNLTRLGLADLFIKYATEPTTVLPPASSLPAWTPPAPKPPPAGYNAAGFNTNYLQTHQKPAPSGVGNFFTGVNHFLGGDVGTKTHNGPPRVPGSTTPGSMPPTPPPVAAPAPKTPVSAVGSTPVPTATPPAPAAVSPVPATPTHPSPAATAPTTPVPQAPPPVTPPASAPPPAAPANPAPALSLQGTATNSASPLMQGQAAPADDNALFRQYHGTNYDPHSHEDRIKMQQLHQTLGHGQPAMLHAANGPWQKMGSMLVAILPGW